MTDMPPLAGGGGYTINLEDKHQQHRHTGAAAAAALPLLSTGWSCGMRPSAVLDDIDLLIK